ALLALAGLERALLEAAAGDHSHPLGQGARNVLGKVSPHARPQEQRLAVLPLTAGAVESPRRRGDREVRHRESVLSETQLRVGCQVADDRDDCLASHAATCFPSRPVRWRPRPRRAAPWCAESPRRVAAGGRAPPWPRGWR